MRLPRWLGGGRGDSSESRDDDTFDLRESKQEREQIWREKIEMDAHIRSLKEIADVLGRAHSR